MDADQPPRPASPRRLQDPGHGVVPNSPETGAAGSGPVLPVLEPVRRRRQRGETRARILDAAAEVFTRRGFEAASLQEIATVAGFSKGAVYSNFKNKQELFVVLMQERIGARERALTGALQQEETIEGQLRMAGRSLTQMLEQQPGWFVLVNEYWARTAHDATLHEQFAAQYAVLRRPFARLLAGGAATLGVILPAPAEELGSALLALMNGLAIEHMAGPEYASGDLFETMLTLVFCGLLVQDDATRDRDPRQDGGERTVGSQITEELHSSVASPRVTSDNPASAAPSQNPASVQDRSEAVSDNHAQARDTFEATEGVATPEHGYQGIVRRQPDPSSHVFRSLVEFVRDELLAQPQHMVALGMVLERPDADEWARRIFEVALEEANRA